MTELMTFPCQCGGRATMSETPWRMPWYNPDSPPSDKGGTIRISCPSCGRSGKFTHSTWPTVAGVFTRVDAILLAWGDFAEAKQ